MPGMGRTPTTDRENVTADDSPVIAMRLTPREATALDKLVRMQQAQADELGIAGAVTRASAMRQLLRQSAKAKGIWDDAQAQPPSVAEPQADPAADLAAVLEAANAELERSNVAPLVMVAAVVRASKLTTPRAHAALNEAARRGQLELRPESGMDRLSKADAALCLPGPQGSVLSVLRVVGAEATKPTKSPKASGSDIASLKARWDASYAAGVPRKTIGDAAGMNPQNVKTILEGVRSASPEMLKRIAAAFKKVGI